LSALVVDSATINNVAFMTVFTLTVNLWFTQRRCHTSKSCIQNLVILKVNYGREIMLIN